MRATFASCWLAASVWSQVAGAGGGEYEWVLPPGFPQPAVPADNPMSAAEVALGCRLFYEPRLSVTRTHSCASCHHPELAFTDGRAHAIGATGQHVRRGAMPLANVAYNPALTWADSRITTLEAQMDTPLFGRHPLEMGLERGDATLVQRWRRMQATPRRFAMRSRTSPRRSASAT